MFQWIKLKPHKIYIIPTRVGAYFILATLVVLLVGSGYSNNLINLLAFFMLSFVFVSMIITHLQLSELKIISLSIESGFEGQELQYQASIQNAAQEEKWGIRIKNKGILFSNQLEPVSLLGRIRPKQNSLVSWSSRGGKRGKHQINEIELDSIYPLGLFYTWKIESVSADYFVYPNPAGNLPLPDRSSTGNAGDANFALAKRGDEFSEHRAYRQGDSGHHIDWKAHARGHPLLVKEMDAGQGDEIVLTWEQLAHYPLTDEERLSQLTAWVRTAAASSRPFRLMIPHYDSLSGLGWPHAQICLEKLAIFSIGPGAS